MLRQGIFEEMSEAEYHALPALGSGSIKLLSQSPAAYAASFVVPFSGSASTELGSAFHMKLLQPERYAQEVVEMEDDFSFATKAGQEFKLRMADERSADPETLLFLKPDRVKIIRAMFAGVEVFKESLGVNPFEGYWREQSEVPHVWHEAGFFGKALVDRKIHKHHWLLDVKTTSSPLDERSLMRTAYDYGWHIQAAWYTRGVRKLQPDWHDSMFAFCVFQTTAPFCVRLVTVPDETLQKANTLVEKALENYLIYKRDMLENKRQFDPNSTPIDLTFPAWVNE
jgi:hypothetical protein